MITPDQCATVETAIPRTIPCHRAACDHLAQVHGGYCPCCFSRRMTEPYPRPKVVVICGSTRFYDAFQEANYRLTMEGKIVLSVGFYAGSPDQMVKEHGEGVGITSEQKVALDELHKRKIDLADEVYVLNVGGYVGESTRSEIEYAEWYEKPITYLEPLDASRPPTCGLCRRERTIDDAYDYNPLQVITGRPLGWYSGDDGEVCPECMTKTLRNQ